MSYSYKEMISRWRGRVTKEDGSFSPSYLYLRTDGNKYEVEDRPIRGYIWVQSPKDGRRYQIPYSLKFIYLSCVREEKSPQDCFTRYGIDLYGLPKDDDYLWSRFWELKKVSKFR